MKVLWLTNMPLPMVAEHAKLTVWSVGGWLTGYLNGLMKVGGVSLISVFPYNRHCSGETEGVAYESFVPHGKDAIQRQFRDVLEKHSPDVMHIFGTEYGQSLYMLEVIKEKGLLSQTVVSMQGLVSYIARHCTAYLPNCVVHSTTLRDFVKRINIRNEQKDFEKKGKDEIEALRIAKNVIGRTDWDRACVKQINPEIRYHFCNEILRDSFYEGKWSLQNCEKYSIFVSQARDPLKGFHLALEALEIIKRKYPEAKLYTTGGSVFRKGFKNKLMARSYSEYLRKLIQRKALADSVVFLGTLSEEQMRERFLKSHIFLSASSIENSSNSVGEAMILGVPTISSNVGGIKNLLCDGVDGYLYPADEPYMIAAYADRIFSDDGLAQKLSENAAHHAKDTHSREKNTMRLLEIYKELFPADFSMK